MISSAEVVRRVVAAPAPMLLIDTSALLDLIRDPRRDSFSADQVKAALRLLQRLTAKPRALWLPLVQQILVELSDNKPGVTQEAEDAIHKLQDLIERVQSIFAAHRLATSAITPGLVASKFPATTDAMVEKFIAAALHVTGPRGIERDAFARVAANRAPSKRGKQAKDCLVFESYLRLATLLRAAGFVQPIVFLTTNTNDYSHLPNKAVPHPDLVGEFSAANVLYAVNFLMAERFAHRAISPKKTSGLSRNDPLSRDGLQKFFRKNPLEYTERRFYEGKVLIEIAPFHAPPCSRHIANKY